MKKTLATLALVSAAALSLSACGGGSKSESAPVAPSVQGITPSAAATATEAAKSPRGNLMKKLGEPAGMTNKDNKQVVNFTIDSITVDAPCTGKYAQPAKNGHFVTIGVTAETTPELATAPFPKFDVNSANFQFIGANGTTYNGNLGSAESYSCLNDAEGFPMAGMGPAEKVTAKVVVDVPEATGTLVFKPLGAMAGWEYKF